MDRVGVGGDQRLRDQRPFMVFWTAETVSGFGSYITSLAISVLIVVTLHEDAAGVGLVNAARWLPYLLLGVVVGTLADRFRRRPVLIATDLLRAAVLIAIPVLALMDRLDLIVLALFMAMFGLLSLLNDASSQSFVPRLVPRSMLTRAHARLDQSDSVAQVAGPAVAGGLVALVTAPFAVLVDAASYLASAVLTARVAAPEPPRAPGSLGDLLRELPGEMRDGLRWVYRHPTLTPFAVATHAWFVCNAAAGAVLPVFALDELDLGPFGFGTLLAVGGVGALVGSSVAERLGARYGAGRVVIATHPTLALAWTTVALSPVGPVGWVTFGAGQLLIGLSMGAENSNSMGYRQTVTPDHLQGRMNAIMRSFNRAMIVVGAPLGGLAATAVGLRPVLLAAAIGFALIGLVLALTPYRHARLDDAHAAAPSPP